MWDQLLAALQDSINEERDCHTRAEARFAQMITAEAYTKYQDHWRQKTSEYSIYYHADCEVMETLL